MTYEVCKTLNPVSNHQFRCVGRGHLAYGNRCTGRMVLRFKQGSMDARRLGFRSGVDSGNDLLVSLYGATWDDTTYLQSSNDVYSSVFIEYRVEPLFLRIALDHDGSGNIGVSVDNCRCIFSHLL